MTLLQQQIAAIHLQIEQIRSEGEIAAPNTWISKFTVVKNGKRYVYHRLMEAIDRRSPSGAIQGRLKKYLGSATSAKYKQAVAAIERRNRLQHLYRQLQKLEKSVQNQENYDAKGVAPESKVSAGHIKAPVLQQPALTTRPTDKQWKQLQQHLNRLTQYCEQLAKSLQEERIWRSALTQDIELLFQQIAAATIVNS